MTTTTEDTPPTWAGVAVAVCMLLVSLAALVVQGAAAAYLGEDDSVTLALVLLPTAAAGWLPLVVAALTRRKGTAIAVGGPIGCGVLVWGAAFVATLVFFAAVWPEL